MLKIFSVRDTKVSSFSKPFTTKNEIEASRAFYVAVNDRECQVSQFPEDFDLFLLGEFDEVTGVIKPVEPPKFIVGAVSLVKLKKMEEYHGNNEQIQEACKSAVDRIHKESNTTAFRQRREYKPNNDQVS